MSTLGLILVYLLAAVLGVVVCRSLRLPPVLGYLAVGVLVGPNALSLAQRNETRAIAYLAEFGVVFLMFVIGLDFSLPKLRTMRRHVFGLGAAQVGFTLVLGMLAALLLAYWLPKYWRINWQAAFALGGALAMSSTAIVVKMLKERAELQTEHGQRTIGVLLFQDLAVVPLLVLIPALGSPPEDLFFELLIASAKAVVLIGILLTFGQKLMSWWLTMVARRKSSELFILNILLITLGLAWLTELAGLSLALGAFMAGMLIAETPYRHQVETDIKPFHDVLLGLFFITVGMMLDWRLVLAHWPLVLMLITLPVLLKLTVVFVAARVLGSNSSLSLRTALYLAQAGEFGFVLLTLVKEKHLITPQLLNPILASMVVSMLIAPFLIMRADRIVARFVRNEWMHQSVAMTEIARKSIAVAEHVIICGFGRCGQNMARILEQQNIPYVALDLDPDRVQRATNAGHSVVFGDASRVQTLVAAGIARASAVTITYLDTANAFRVLSAVRSISPTLPVIVRTQDDHDLNALQAAGATEVVPEAIEGSILLAVHALAIMGMPLKKVIDIVQEQRAARYQLLRGYFRGYDDDTASERNSQHLSTIDLAANSPYLGQDLEHIDCSKFGTQCLDVRRAGVSLPDFSHQPLQAHDVLVLQGTPEALLALEHFFSSSPPRQ